MPREKVKKGGSGVHRIEAVQCQDRAPLAAAHHFELDAVHPQLLGSGVRHRMRPPAKLRGGFIAMIGPFRNGGCAWTGIPLPSRKNPKRHAECPRYSIKIACIPYA